MRASRCSTLWLHYTDGRQTDRHKQTRNGVLVPACTTGSIPPLPEVSVHLDETLLRKGNQCDPGTFNVPLFAFSLRTMWRGFASALIDSMTYRSVGIESISPGRLGTYGQ
jgi:hypothetical protein